MKNLYTELYSADTDLVRGVVKARQASSSYLIFLRSYDVFGEWAMNTYSMLRQEIIVQLKKSDRPNERER